MIRSHPSPNHGPRLVPVGTPAPVIDMLVLHYTGMRSAGEALSRLCDPAAQVSAHYMVDEDGSILQLVEESERAWHAGASEWRGRRDVNSRSIGVEIVNPGHAFGYRPFPPRQMEAVVTLCQGILGRNPRIGPAGVVGHSDIAPTRKEDPGELFDWPLLARAGVGLYPSPEQMDDAACHAEKADPATLLADIGYPLEGGEGLRQALAAFQRRYRPATLSGQADAKTRCLLVAVSRLLNGCP